MKTNKKLTNLKFKNNGEIISEYDYNDIIYCFGKPKIIWKYTNQHKSSLYKLALPNEILKQINGFLDQIEEHLYWVSIFPDNQPDSINDTHINLTKGKIFLELDSLYCGVEITNVINNIFQTYHGMGSTEFMN